MNKFDHSQPIEKWTSVEICASFIHGKGGIDTSMSREYVSSVHLFIFVVRNSLVAQNETS